MRITGVVPNSLISLLISNICIILTRKIYVLYISPHEDEFDLKLDELVKSRKYYFSSFRPRPESGMAAKLEPRNI